MASDERDDGGEVYRVVANHEGQHALWLAELEIPVGWTDAGKSGPSGECLAYVEGV